MVALLALTPPAKKARHLAHARCHHGGEGHPTARIPSATALTSVAKPPCRSTPSTMPRPQPPPPTKKSKKTVTAGVSAAAMARWGNHRDRFEAARRRITVEHGHTGLSLLAPVRVERTARVVPTSSAERAASLKGPGLSTAHRDATHYYYSAVLGLPPREDEDGADLWGSVGGVSAETRAQIWIPGGSSAIVKGVLEGCWEANQSGEAYDADGWLRTRGRKAIFK